MTIKTLFARASCILLLSIWAPLSALALDLGEAKSAGLVGEINSGYIGAIKSSAEVNALVDSINSLRQAEYQKIAAKNGISLQAVEVRAGQKAMGKTPAGYYVDTGAGWEKK